MLVIALLVGEDVRPADRRSPSPAALLRNAALIWLSNVLRVRPLVLGGRRRRSGRRATRGPTSSDDLVFPQRQHEGARRLDARFLDYLFLAFNSSTAFSPTDTLVLSRRMKVLMMCQSLISLSVLAVVAARAVNALG